MEAGSEKNRLLSGEMKMGSPVGPFEVIGALAGMAIIVGIVWLIRKSIAGR